MERKVALFDFDKTLIDQDSIFLLWKYAIRKHPLYLFFFLRKLFPKLFLWIFSRFNFTHIKNGLLSIFHKLEKEELEEFVYEVLPLHFFPEGLKTIEDLKKDGYILFLVSASPEIYLEYIKNILPFHYIMGTKTNKEFQMIGKNNRQEEKVRRIHECCKENNIKIDYENSISFSDSYHADHPMMELTKNRYLINSNFKKEGYKHFSWKL
ncbi:MAG: HAD family hydrolase [Tissierellia bacterium]|nr:HAD family hydrolase [Tissierellia bacterium]